MSLQKCGTDSPCTGLTGVKIKYLNLTHTSHSGNFGPSEKKSLCMRKVVFQRTVVCDFIPKNGEFARKGVEKP
jgi:hypothetical protein